MVLAPATGHGRAARYALTRWRGNRAILRPWQAQMVNRRTIIRRRLQRRGSGVLMACCGMLMWHAGNNRGDGRKGLGLAMELTQLTRAVLCWIPEDGCGLCPRCSRMTGVLVDPSSSASERSERTAGIQRKKARVSAVESPSRRASAPAQVPARWFSTVTERRFCDQQEMSSHTATGRSLP